MNRQSGKAAPWIIGCSVLLLIIIATVVVGGFFAVKKVKEGATEFSRQIAIEGVTESNLDEESKQALITRIDGLADDFLAGEVTVSQLPVIMNNLVEGPLFTSLMAHSLEQTYIAQSSLPEEDKAEAKLQLQRVLHGLVENQITGDELTQLLSPVMEISSDGTQQLKPAPTEEELRQVMEDARALADSRNISEEGYKLDIGAEIDRAVADAKGETLP